MFGFSLGPYYLMGTIGIIYFLCLTSTETLAECGTHARFPINVRVIDFTGLKNRLENFYSS